VTVRQLKRVAVIQSNYIPWKGYFDIIADVDLFVFYDDVQYTKNDWRNRNRIKTPQGLAWLTVPVHASLDQAIFEVRIGDPEWAQKHWKTLQQNYARAPHFNRYKRFLEDTYLGRRWEHLSELNQHLIVGIARDLLGCTTAFADSRAFKAEGKRLDRLLDLLVKVGVTTYVSGPSARNYIDESRFNKAGIDLEYKSYDGYPVYDQLHPPFAHAVSVLDVLFHLGPEAPAYIWGWRGEAVERRA